jgi:hypothetical protein
MWGGFMERVVGNGETIAGVDARQFEFDMLTCIFMGPGVSYDEAVKLAREEFKELYPRKRGGHDGESE